MTDEVEKMIQDAEKQEAEKAAVQKTIMDENKYLKEEMRLQGHALQQLQEDYFIMRKTLERMFRVMKDRGMIEGTWVAGAVIK